MENIENFQLQWEKVLSENNEESISDFLEKKRNDLLKASFYEKHEFSSWLKMEGLLFYIIIEKEEIDINIFFPLTLEELSMHEDNGKFGKWKFSIKLDHFWHKNFLKKSRRIENKKPEEERGLVVNYKEENKSNLKYFKKDKEKIKCELKNENVSPYFSSSEENFKEKKKESRKQLQVNELDSFLEILDNLIENHREKFDVIHKDNVFCINEWRRELSLFQQKKVFVTSSFGEKFAFLLVKNELDLNFGEFNNNLKTKTEKKLKLIKWRNN